MWCATEEVELCEDHCLSRAFRDNLLDAVREDYAKSRAK